jgi:hypothetical protein
MITDFGDFAQIFGEKMAIFSKITGLNPCVKVYIGYFLSIYVGEVSVRE